MHNQVKQLTFFSTKDKISKLTILNYCCLSWYFQHGSDLFYFVHEYTDVTVI